MQCIYCDNNSKYKCPTCTIPYCSVHCYKTHKENPCEAPKTGALPPEKLLSQNEYEFPSEDTVPINKLKLLEHSKELKLCMENPHVRTILEKLDSAACPDDLIQEYMLEPIFTEFVDACLKVVENN